MNEEIENDEGWGNLVGPKKIKKIQEKFGVEPHEHTNGLMSCTECVNLVIFGETLKKSAEKMAKSFWEDATKDCKHDLNYPDFCKVCFPEE